MTGDENKRRNLGRGLSALLGAEQEDLAALDQVRAAKLVPTERLHPGRFQPRRRFPEAEMAALVVSIREKGILQPILVRRHSDQPNDYEIVAGERRWRAAQRAQLHEIPVVVKDLGDADALEIALVENIQRQDLSPLEEADGYRRLMEEFQHTQEKLAKVVGKSRSHVANAMRLLSLPAPVKELVEDGELSAGHARALLNADNPAALAAEVVARGLNVRQTERRVKSGREGTAPKRSKPEKTTDTLALERELSIALGLKVTLRSLAEATGELVIRYQTLEQLDDVLQRITQRPA